MKKQLDMLARFYIALGYVNRMHRLAAPKWIRSVSVHGNERKDGENTLK